MKNSPKKMNPAEVLDRALEGKGLRLTFDSFEDARAFRLRMQSEMAVAARRSRVDFAPDDPAWGLHPWPRVVIKQESAMVLWVGVWKFPKVEEGVEPDG